MKAVIAAAALALSLTACSGETVPSPDPGSAGPSQSGAATVAGVPAAVQRPGLATAIGSRFIPFSTCKAVEVKEDEDWSVSKCEAPAGFTVFLDYGDARDDLRLKPRGGKEVSLGMSNAGGGGFNTLGPTFEWRGRGAGAAFVPHALIVRNAVSDDPEHSERQTSMRAVIDLTRLCIAALVRPGPDQNERARAIADGGRQDCLTRGD